MVRKLFRTGIVGALDSVPPQDETGLRSWVKGLLKEASDDLGQAERWVKGKVEALKEKGRKVAEAIEGLAKGVAERVKHLPDLAKEAWETARKAALIAGLTVAAGFGLNFFLVLLGAYFLLKNESAREAVVKYRS